MDDLPVVRLTLRKILEKEGFRCLEASDGEEALDMVAREAPELMLCDIQMPNMDGLQVVKALGGRIPEVAVVMVSSVEETGTAVECIQLGAFGYVHKPFHPREILVQVSSALRRRMLEIDYRDRERVLARKVREQTLEIRNSREEIAIRLISASEERDNETGAHVRRIGLYAAHMATVLGWTQEGVDAIRAAAPMHDIGKIGVPDAILQKPGPLTEEEWVVMRQHTIMGARILQGSSVPFIQMAARIAAGHHEKWDGSGYPRGLKGEQIPLEARITAIGDVFDALSHRRYYKEAWPESKALELLKEGRGTHFDPDLLDLFLDQVQAVREICGGNPDLPPEVIVGGEG
ncbi:MAG: response regulator [Acidobacteria bacterium]|nr:response regulator [Acidobacteriota bacterium]